MRCQSIQLPGFDHEIIVCGPAPRRICDICDRRAAGPQLTLRDGRKFDACTRCRQRIERAKQAHQGGALAVDDREWMTEAAGRIDAALSGARPA